MNKSLKIGRFLPIIFASLTLFTLFIIGGFFYWLNQTAAVSLSPIKYTFVVQRGESITSIASKLAEKKLIKNPFLFKIFIKLNKLENRIQAGSFLLSPSQNTLSLIGSLTNGTFDVWITIPEGLRKEEVADIIKKELNINVDEFIKNSQEGHLFPDTYLIPKNYRALDIIKLMEENFANKTSQLKVALNEKDLIIASIVEREASFKEDRPIIAGILKKRLQENWALETDATVQYALGYDITEKTWWKKNLTQSDLQIDSPYNTRKYPGLPPKPICNPGLEAITAVQMPKVSPYWFYLSDSSGKMHYSVTLEDHNKNITNYLLTN